MKSSGDKPFGGGSALASDAGNVAIELVVLGILLPTMVVGFALNLLSVQRSSLAAQQLAREAVRISAIGRWTGKASELLRNSTADELGVETDRVSIEVVQAQNAEVIVATATATVNGRVEQARMVVQR